MFFKIDGDSVFVDIVAGDDALVHGECTIVTSDGSHGNLGDRDVDAGDTVVVPFGIGEFRTTLRPIPVDEELRRPGQEDAGGIVGVVLVLMEEDQVTDAGARAGYAALVDFVREAINNDIIPKLGLEKQDLKDEEIAALADAAFDAVHDAIASIQTGWETSGAGSAVTKRSGSVCSASCMTI